MSDKRRARKAKQVRRDERRAKKRNGEGSADWTLRDAIRRSLAGHPLGLLSMASVVINAAKPEPLFSLKSGQLDTDCMERVLNGLIGVRNRETTVLLAAVAELLVDDAAAQLRCRHEVAERGEHLPRWITALPRVDVYRAVRRTDVFGDVDELVIGMRLDGRHELTFAVLIDHNAWSSVVDACAMPDPIDEALARAAETSSDTSVFEMTLADARVWIEDALDKPIHALETETWPLYRALVQWLVSRLPEGGEHRSPARDYIPLEVALDAPDLLRAFIPYAHAQSGIRDELTSRTLATVDVLRSSYKREVLKAKYWRLDDAV